MISICIPSLDRSEYLQQSLQRISDVAPLCNWQIEVIVADNASDYNSYQPIRDFIQSENTRHTNLQFVYIRHEKRIDAVSNWNSAIRLASQKYFMLLSDDDLIDSNFSNLFDIDTRIALLSQDPDIIFSSSATIDSNGKYLWHRTIKNEKWLPSLSILRMLAFRQLRPRLCSIFFSTSLQSKCKLRFLSLGDSGDHADGMFILSYLTNTSSKILLTTIITSQYRIHPQSYSSAMRFKAVARTKFLFISELFTANFSLPCKLYGLIWIILGFMPHILRPLLIRKFYQ